ncbi:DUF6597 domain-containing transcriptional factor [Bacteroides uniformis]|uniref:DUF6597 domain-containing transcriptional factor n=1 Tax=Bacteroides uniformis TaxID=820 RepID=UPI00319DB06E
MEKIQVIQPTKLLAPYIKQYWFLRIDDVKQGFQRSIPAGCVALVFHKGNKIISSFHGKSSVSCPLKPSDSAPLC